MGHSEASLYKKASICCPLTHGSFGSCISCGVMSVCEPLLLDVLRAARALARPLKKGVVEEGGEAMDGREELKAGCEGERLAEVSEV